MFARFYSEFFEISRIFIAKFISFRTFLYRKSADGVCFRIGMTIFAGRRAEFRFEYPVYDLPLLPMLFEKEAYRRDNYPRVE